MPMEQSINSNNKQSSKKLLFLGLGWFVNNTILNLSKTRECLVVDLDPSEEEEAWKDNPNIKFYTGDINSIVVWKKLPLDEISHIIFSQFTLGDLDVTMELCRIARETFKLDIPIIAMADIENTPDFAEIYNVVVVDPLAVGISAVKEIIEKNYATPSNIGLGKGEMLEVNVIRRSYLIDRKLRYMESSKWRVAAIYRDSELVLPNGESEIKVGDRVVLVGDPKMLSNMVNIFMQGIPQFPLQYGSNINVVVKDSMNVPLDEANYLRVKLHARSFNLFSVGSLTEKLKSNDAVASMEVAGIFETNYRDKNMLKDVGMVVLDASKRFSVFNRRVRYFFKRNTSPTLFARGTFPYASVVVSLNSIYPSQALEAAMEISRLMSLPIEVIYVAPPKELRHAAEEQDLQDRHQLVRDYESIERIKLEYTVLEGNPVKKTVEYIGSNSRALFIVGHDREERLTPFEPHIAFLLAERLSISVMILPVKE